MPREPKNFLVDGVVLNSNILAEKVGICVEAARIRCSKYLRGAIPKEALYRPGRNDKTGAIRRSYPVQEWKTLGNKERPLRCPGPGSWERAHIPDDGRVGGGSAGRPKGAAEMRESYAYVPGQLLLGAAALGDIGRHFPDTDPRYKGISSRILLNHVGELLRKHRFAVVNVDATIILEQPRIAAHADAMRQNIARSLDVSPDQVSVKATTSEGMGFVGSGKGASAHAVALLVHQ